MVIANKNDKNRIVEILTHSFYNNLSVNYITGHQQSEKRIRALMDYSFEQCYLFGEIYLSDDKNACALLLYPQKKYISFRAIWLDVRLIFKAIGVSRIFKALKREAAIKKLKPKTDMVYLWFIGVDPLEQHKGYGSSLLTDILKMAGNLNLPVFLETSTLNNLPWYEHFGFEVYDKFSFGHTLFFLKKDIG